MTARKARRPSIHTLISQVEKIGRPVKRVIFTPDGGFELILEDMAPSSATAANEVNRWFEENARTA